MEILNTILGIIFCGALVAIVYVLQKWNVKWKDALHLHIEQNNEAKEELCLIQEWPAMGYYYVMQGNTGVAKVFAKYISTSVCIKSYCSNDAAYNKLCAEELVEKLNERI